MTFLFWLFLSLIVYCYFGYPLLIRLLAGLFPKKILQETITPSVSVVISACNEEDVIERKIQNLLNMDYPQGSLEILIGSDGSTDSTDKIAQKYSDRIRFFSFSQRRGKVAVLNDLVPKAAHEIILFTDCRQTFAEDAVRLLVQNFADPKVGCASGELMFKEEGGTSQGINFYWKYEKFIRNQESRFHSMLGATGAIYAIRKSLYVATPSNIVLDDMYTPLSIIRKGYRAVFDGTAHAFDKAADDPREEHRRKARTLYGNYQIFSHFPDLFNPLRSPVAVQFFSHKLLRVIAPFCLIGLFLVNLALADEDFYRLIFILQIAFYTAALIGGLSRNIKHGILKALLRVCYIPYVFCLLNFSALVGFIRFIFSKQEVTWQKAREPK